MSYNTRSEARMRYFRPSGNNYNNDPSGYNKGKWYGGNSQRGGGSGGGPGSVVVPPVPSPSTPNNPSPMPPRPVAQASAQPTQPKPLSPQQPSQLNQGVQEPPNYTQPAYSTQPGYVNQPPVKPVVQGGPMAQQKQPAVDSSVKKEEATEKPIEEDTDGENAPKQTKPWMKKAFNFRVSKKIRKRRQNARLRQLLSPKNAMMLLHELHPELKIVATEQLNAANQMVYTVDIEIEGRTYRGHGMSKLSAKQAGCENAVKAILLDKMAKSSAKTSQEVLDDSGADMESMKNEEEGAAPMETEAGAEGAKPHRPRRQFAEDDVPWGSLASFALYKLFSEWQSQGYQIPPTATNMVVNNPPQVHFQRMPGLTTMAPMRKIPEDASQKHPVQLLNQLRPGSQYSETREGTPPNLTFTFTVVIDGQTYQGIGTSKKEAKKECAKAALIAMGVKYD